MSSGMFRGKESSNRIELSRLVQELLKFGVLGSLWLWGGGRWVVGCLGVSGGIGGAPTFMHMHAHTCIELQLAASMEASMFSMFSMFNMHVRACVRVCVCVHVHACMGHPHTLIPTPTPIHPSVTPQGGPPESVKIR